MEKSSLCEVCNYSLRLTRRKDTNHQNNADIVEQVLIDPANVANFLPIDLKALSESGAFKGRSRSEKTKILKAIPPMDVDYYHRCKNPQCSFTRLLPKGTVIYRDHKKSAEKDFGNFGRFQPKLSTFPHTAKYICPNKSCKTHTNPGLREAVFFRVRNTLQLVYICNVCKHYWRKA
jgi:hypothetical protein